MSNHSNDDKNNLVKSYIIYHIKDKKVGCTVNFEHRKRGYPKDTEFDILEILDGSVGDEFAGDREWFWADQFGYPKGQHYATSNWSSKLTTDQRSAAGKKGGPIGGKRTVELGLNKFRNQTREQKSAAGKKGGFVTGIAGKSGGPAAAKNALDNHIIQRVRLMRELGTVQQSNTFFGKIELREGELVLVSADERIKEFITRNKLAARMMSEVPNK
jgi:hypothetical protein